MNIRLCFYDISEYDFNELLQTLAFEQYFNVEFSALKFYRVFPELMRMYDVRDEYELHNLLKKLHNNAEDSCISFKRMPTIEFGVAEGDMQMLDLLLQCAPVSINDLADAYEQEYVVRAETVKANYFKNFDEYYYNGIYKIDVAPLSLEEINTLKDELTGDFYSTTDIKEIYLRKVPGSEASRINPCTIKQLGFRVYPTYAINNTYAIAAEYFFKILTEQDMFDLREYPKAMAQAVSFTT